LEFDDGTSVRRDEEYIDGSFGATIDLLSVGHNEGLLVVARFGVTEG